MGRKPLTKGESVASITITLPIKMQIKIAEHCEKFNFKRSELVRLALDNYFDEGEASSNLYKELQNKTTELKEKNKEIKLLRKQLDKTEKELDESNMIAPAIANLKEQLSEVKRENKIIIKERDKSSRQLKSIKKKLSRLIE